MNVGLSFSFGSVYSNVVNPRFGGGFGGTGGGWYSRSGRGPDGQYWTSGPVNVLVFAFR